MKSLFGWVKQVRIEHLWVLAVLVGVFTFVNTHPIRPNDFWFHAATGRETLLTGHIPQVDTFSYTRFGAPYLSNNTFWLMQVALYGVYVNSGAAWLILLTSLTITLAYGLLVKIGFMLTGNWRAAAFGALFATALGVDNWNVRPQVAAYLFASIVLLFIYSYRLKGGRHWLVGIPVVMWFWVNSHGTFFIGLVLIVFWGLDVVWQVFQRWVQSKRWEFQHLIAPLVVGVVSGLVCLLNPLGFGIVHYLTNMSTNPVIQDLILEWQPPNFSTAGGILFIVLLVSAGVFLILSSVLSPNREFMRRVDLFQVFCFLFLGFLGLRYNRAIVWFGIILAPVIAAGTAALMARFKSGQKNEVDLRRTQGLNLGLFFVLSALAFLSLPWFKPLWPVVPEKKGLLAYDTPIRATQFMLEEKLPAPVFADLAFGSYFDWAAVPQYRVFVDPRFELYPVEIWDDYVRINAANADWENRLEKYGIQTLMLHPQNQSALIAAALQARDWEKLYQDEAAVIFTRR